MLQINAANEVASIVDHNFALDCPHCGTFSTITAISIPRFELIQRFDLALVGIAYSCDKCKEPIFLRFKFRSKNFANRYLDLNELYEEVQRPIPAFEFSYLPEAVGSDFREALTSYSAACYNAFAAMCRRTVQSVATDLGARGNDRVLSQVKALKEMAEIDDETFDLLKQIIIDGHDGAHPHLPTLNESRATILLELMKDVLYQLYVRKGKIEEAAKLRKKTIDESKSD